MPSPTLPMRTAALKPVSGLIVLCALLQVWDSTTFPLCDHLEWIWIYRMEGGIPPLVELLEFTDTKVQRAAAGALRTLAFKNDENKNQVMGLSFIETLVLRGCTLLNHNIMTLQIVECNALPTLILMLRSEDTAIHYEAVGYEEDAIYIINY